MEVLLILNALNVILPIVIGIVCLGAGIGGGILIAKKMINDKMAKANISAEKIIEDANAKAEEKKRASIAETKQEIHQLKSEADREIRERRRSVADLENKINQREQRLDNRSSNLDKREDNLIVKEHKIDEMKNQIDQQYAKAEKTVQEQEEKLVQISGMSQEKAREIIMERVENDMAMEIAGYQMEQEEKAKKEAKKKAELLLANAIQQ